MYYRLYPTKANTIFQQFDSNTNSVLAWSENVNVGANPVLEIRDGAAISKIIVGFTISDWLKNKLEKYQFEVKIKFYDAGAQYDAMLPLKDISISSFTNDFAEGDGWHFNETSAYSGVSNWKNNLSNELWSDVVFTPIETIHPNHIHDDIIFDVKSSLSGSIPNIINYAVEVVTPQTDINILTKFLWGPKTKTVFKPYLEFIIDDTIQDKSNNLVAQVNNKIYLINDNGSDFSSTVTASIINNSGTTTSLIVNKEIDGVYYVIVNPSEPQYSNKKENVIINWEINNIPFYKQTLNVQPNNKLFGDINYKNVAFYAVTPYTYPIINQGDIIPFEIISQVRGKGDVILNTYEYRVTNASGFEMIPWSPVSTYKNKMSFEINTDFFYPENQYEIFIRNRMNNFSITSHLTYKFLVSAPDASHLRSLSASPYFNRTTYSSK